MISDRPFFTIKIDANVHVQYRFVKIWYHWGIPVYLQLHWLKTVFGQDNYSFKSQVLCMKALSDYYASPPLHD